MSAIRVVTYNIRHGKGIDGIQNLDRIIEVLRSVDPDIIGLQEVDFRQPRSRFANQARTIASMLGFDYAYASNYTLGPFGGMGNAILTKTKMLKFRNQFLPSTGERRGLLLAAIEINSQPVHIYCTHWGLDEAKRQAQSAACAEIILESSSQTPTIFLGDLNAVPTSSEVLSLQQSANLQFACAPSELTFTSDRPYARIDYIMHSMHLRLLNAYTIKTHASDHLPLIAELEI